MRDTASWFTGFLSFSLPFVTIRSRVWKGSGIRVSSVLTAGFEHGQQLVRVL